MKSRTQAVGARGWRTMMAAAALWTTGGCAGNPGNDVDVATMAVERCREAAEDRRHWQDVYFYRTLMDGWSGPDRGPEYLSELESRMQLEGLDPAWSPFLHEQPSNPWLESDAATFVYGRFQISWWRTPRGRSPNDWRGALGRQSGDRVVDRFNLQAPLYVVSDDAPGAIEGWVSCQFVQDVDTGGFWFWEPGGDWHVVGEPAADVGMDWVEAYTTSDALSARLDELAAGFDGDPLWDYRLSP